MPPEPVTGLCCLPRRRTVSSTSRRDPVGVRPPGGLLHLAEARGVDVERLDGDDNLALVDGLDARHRAARRAAAGPPGARARGGCRAGHRVGSSRGPLNTLPAGRAPAAVRSCTSGTRARPALADPAEARRDEAVDAAHASPRGASRASMETQPADGKPRSQA